VCDALSPASSAVLQSMSYGRLLGMLQQGKIINGLGNFRQTCTTFSLMHMDSGGGSTQKGGGGGGEGFYRGA